MKRIVTLVMALVLLLTLASCGKKETTPTTVATTVAPTEATTEATEPPAPTEPETEPGISRAGYGEAVFKKLNQGEEVEVTGQFKDYYVIAGEDVDLLIEKQYVRMADEEGYETWDGYAKDGTKVYDNVYLKGEPIAELTKNTKVKVLEGGKGWLYIEWEGGKGYVNADQISKWYISGKKNSPSSNGSGNGGQTVTPNDGTDVPLGSLSAKDFNAELILLGAYYGPEMETEFTGGKAVVLAQDVECYICLLIRDDEAKVLTYDEETITIYLENELTATLPRWLLRLEGDEEYESWTGYSKWNGVVYEEYQMRNEWKKLHSNKEVLVIDELPDCYVVEVDGEIGYMELDKVSKTRIVNRGNSGNGSGSGSGSGSSSGDTWTPPAL